MNEKTKTTIFVTLAILLGFVAYQTTKSSQQTFQVEDMVGQELFPELTDALQVTSMEIVRYDEKTGEMVPFEVRQVNHQWSLPSHDHYPADAENQVVQAATSLMGLRVIRVVSRNASSHADYGVLEPDPTKVRMGDSGIGEKVVLKNAQGEILLNLIIGKEVDAGSGKRYVRRLGQDPVYIVELKTENLSADFADWIEKDLMKLQPWDITGLDIYDYSLDLAAGTTNIRGNVRLDYADMQTPDWTLESNQVPLANGAMVERPMPEGKVLNRTKLNECRNALAEMRIVDVAKKPDGLTADLKVPGNLAFSQDAVESLKTKGFHLIEFPIEGGKTQRVLLSNEGEMRVVCKNGVAYVLRFGNIAGKQAFTETMPESESANLNRYLFIMADLEPDTVAKETLQPLPKEPAHDASEEVKSQYAAQKVAIEATNKALEEKNQKALEEAQKRVQELNDRFASWYYIIPDSVYQQIHLDYGDIFVPPSETEVQEEPHHEHDGHEH